MDPWARGLFAARHVKDGQRLTWLQQDFMETLPALLQQWPDATLLFANSLGQQGLLQDEPEQTQALFDQLTERLAGRLWFSYHDRLSLHFDKPVAAAALGCLQQGLDGLKVTGPLDAQRLMDLLDLRSLAAPPRLVTDHLTEHLLPAGSQRQFGLLALTPRALHIIEAGWSNHHVNTPAMSPLPP